MTSSTPLPQTLSSQQSEKNEVPARPERRRSSILRAPTLESISEQSHENSNSHESSGGKSRLPSVKSRSPLYGHYENVSRLSLPGGYCPTSYPSDVEQSEKLFSTSCPDLHSTQTLTVVSELGSDSVFEPVSRSCHSDTDYIGVGQNVDTGNFEELGIYDDTVQSSRSHSLSLPANLDTTYEMAMASAMAYKRKRNVRFKNPPPCQRILENEMFGTSAPSHRYFLPPDTPCADATALLSPEYQRDRFEYGDTICNASGHNEVGEK